MDVAVLESGRVRGKGRRGALRHLPGGWAATTVPVNVVCLEHPDGICLFDTGPPERPLRGLSQFHPWLRLARFEHTGLTAALAAHGIVPRDVRRVVVSHLHVDHVGGLGLFPQADVIVSRVEWARAQGLRGRARGYVPHLWPPGLKPRLVTPEPPAPGPFAGSYDVTGDGTLVVVPTPGHTPGHLSLLSRLGRRSILCGGDLVPPAATLDAVAPEIARWCEETSTTFVSAHETTHLIRPDDASRP